MDNDYYHSSDYKDKLNEGLIDATPDDDNINNLSEIPAPTPDPTPAIYIPPVNNNQSNSSFPIEKSYYETNESNQQQESIQRKTCGIKCFKRYDNINIFFIRIFLTNYTEIKID